MLAQERYNLILNTLNEYGTVKNSDLAKRLGVSSETIRKDLEYLAQEGYLIRVHGGALKKHTEDNSKTSSQNSAYISLSLRNSQNVEQKKKITEYAANLISEQQVIALDYGSTSQLMASILKEKFSKLTIVTNSLQNAFLLSECPGFTIILTGGVLNKNEFTLADVYPNVLEHLHIDMFFMSVSGIDPVIGCTDLGFSEANVQNWMRNAAEKTVVLADSSKFGRNSLVKVCPVDNIDMVITDDGVSEEIISSFEKIGTELVVVK